MNQAKKSAVKQFNLSTVLLLTFIVISALPLSIFFVFTQNEVISEPQKLEEEQQLHKLEDKLGKLTAKIDFFKDVFDFVSQLPAALEILDHGKDLSGSCCKNY